MCVCWCFKGLHKCTLTFCAVAQDMMPKIFRERQCSGGGGGRSLPHFYPLNASVSQVVFHRCFQVWAHHVNYKLKEERILLMNAHKYDYRHKGWLFKGEITMRLELTFCRRLDQTSVWKFKIPLLFVVHKEIEHVENRLCTSISQRCWQ